jgi:hypothetical protein
MERKNRFWIKAVIFFHNYSGMSGLRVEIFVGSLKAATYAGCEGHRARAPQGVSAKKTDAVSPPGRKDRVAFRFPSI